MKLHFSDVGDRISVIICRIILARTFPCFCFISVVSYSRLQEHRNKLKKMSKRKNRARPTGRHTARRTGFDCHIEIPYIEICYFHMLKSRVKDCLAASFFCTAFSKGTASSGIFMLFVLGSALCPLSPVRPGFCSQLYAE